MNYGDLKQILNNERKYGALTKIPNDFYKETNKMLNNLSMENNINVKLYRNTKTTFTEIIERRLAKISSSVLYSITDAHNNKYLSDIEPPINLIEDERDLYLMLLNDYYDFYKNVNNNK